jgi:hypothetical protein
MPRKSYSVSPFLAGPRPRVPPPVPVTVTRVQRKCGESVTTSRWCWRRELFAGTCPGASHGRNSVTHVGRGGARRGLVRTGSEGGLQSNATVTDGRVSCHARTKNSTSDLSSRSSTARGYRTAHAWSLSCAAKQPAFRRLSINSGSNAPMLMVTRTAHQHVSAGAKSHYPEGQIDPY